MSLGTHMYAWVTSHLGHGHALNAMKCVSVRAESRGHVCHDSYVSRTHCACWITRACVPWLMCVTNSLCVLNRGHVCHDSYVPRTHCACWITRACVPWLIFTHVYDSYGHLSWGRLGDVTKMWRDSCVHVTWLMHMFALTCLYSSYGHLSWGRDQGGTWLIHTYVERCHVTYSLCTMTHLHSFIIFV